MGRMRAGTARFVHAQDGSVLTIWALSLAALMGLLALTYDFGRLSATQSELQSFVDNVALAAAGELDGNSDAIDRATAAAAEMIADTQTFGSGGSLLSGADDYTLSFHDTLPTEDGTGNQTSNQRDARFVRVVAENQTVDPGFSAVFAALTDRVVVDSEVGGEAIAGFTALGCDITPMMFCLPSADFRANDNIGATVQLRSGGQGAGWGPGAFGFLDPSAAELNPNGVCAGLNGARLDICLIGAAGSTSGCFSANGVTIAPGQRVGNFEAAVNTRFDIFSAGANNLRNDPDYAPAPHVLTGFVSARGNRQRANGNGNQCLGQNVLPSLDTVGFPPDDCHRLGTCGRFGNGDWTIGRAAYVATNYGGIDPHPQARTRYEYYLAEIAAAGGAASTTPIIRGASETGRPQCSPHQSTDPGRRVMIAAGIDCLAENVRGGARNIQVKEFVEVFLPAAVGLDGTRDVWVEIIGSGGSAAGGASREAVFRDVVRLYK